MATIFLQLSCIDIWANGIRDTKTTETSEMSARKDLEDFNDLFQSARDDVTQNDTLYFGFALSYSSVIKSDGFDGCFGIVITSNKGCIVAHPSQSQNRVNIAINDIKEYYEKHHKILSGAKVYIYAQVEFWSQDEIKQFSLYKDLEKSLKEITGVAPDLVKYIDPPEACRDKQNNAIPGRVSDKGVYGKLVIKCGKDESSEPTVSFITIPMQIYALES